MQRAIDSNNIALAQHLLQAVHTTAAYLLLDLWLEWLIVIVKQLLAVEGLQSAEYTLADAANSHGADNLALKIVLIPVYSSQLKISFQ
jgi:hypothetical protein